LNQGSVCSVEGAVKSFIKQKILKPIISIFQMLVNKLTYNRITDSGQFSNFNNVSNKYTEILNSFGPSVKPEELSNGYFWEDWILKISNSFKNQVSIKFLNQPEISYTMVFSHNNGFASAAKRINFLKKVFTDDVTRNLLREDFVGGPNIVSFEYLTSANRSHHAFHLARYTELTSKKLWDTSSVLEFGGGYGNMARLLKKMNPELTYTIIDLPELLSLQYVYLGAIFGEEKINCIFNKDQNIASGKINLVPSSLVLNNDVSLMAESFISTWAVTESPKPFQDDVLRKEFFKAKNILIGSLVDSNNHLKNKICKDFSIGQVQFLPKGHEYWVR